MWSISHHKGYCSRLSTVRPPHPCGLSCGAAPLGRRPPSWTVYRLACHRLHPWLRVTFAMVPDAAWPGSDQQPWSTAPATGPVGRLGRPSAPDPWGVGSFLSPDRPTCVRCPGPSGSCSPVCPLGVVCCVCGVLGLPAPVHRCARSLCCVACAVSWASRLLFTGVPARCVVLRVRCPGPPGSCSLVCPLGVLCCVCGVLGLPAPVHRCARSVCCVACAVSWASRLLFTGVPARCVVLRVRCPGPPGSCSPVCPLGVLCCVCGVLGLPAPVHRCARSVCCVACAVSWAFRLLFTGAPARCVVLRVRCPGPPGFCSPVCPLGVWCCVCGVLGLLAPVHRCARSVCCVACAVSWASWLLFTGVPARCVVLRVRCPGPPGSCSPVCPLGVLRCVCGVLGLPAPVHRCARSVCCFACAVSWASRLLFTGVPARCVVLRVRRPGPPGSFSPVRPLAVLCCVCGVLGLPAPVHLCARSVCCVGCAVSWVSWLLFTGVPARCVVLRVRCPGPPGSCSPVRPLGVLCCVCGVLGLPASVHRCARSVCGVGCAVSWASWLLFTGVPARCVVLRVRRPGPPGSCSPVCPLGVLCSVCGVLGLLAPVHRCARSVCCVACVASWASWLLFTGVPALCVVLRVRCPGPPGSCSPVCPLGVLCCVCGVLGLPAPVHRCARSVCCVACAVSWASRLLFTGVPARCVVFFFFSCAVSWASPLLFTGVPARCVVLRVRRPGPPGSSSPVCPLGVLCCVCGVLGLLAPVHRCARSVCCVACAASWASWLLFTGVPARCVVLRVRCPGPPGSCSPVCLLVVLCCVCGVLGLLAPVHRCARSVCCVACAVSWAFWPLFTGVPPRCVVLRVRRPGPPGSCSPVCPLGVLRCACGVVGLPAPVHRCARSVCCVACAASWASWLLFTGVPARCVVLRARCPGPPGSCSPVCPLGVLCCVCGVLGLLAPIHRCARSVCCVACAASWASWLLFAGVPAQCVALRARCRWPPGSCSPVCPLGVLCCVCGVLGLLAPVHRCARSLCCVACAASWASWLLFTGVPARCVVLRVRRPGPPGSCSPMCPLGVLCCVCGVLGLLAPVHRCARSVCCVAVRGVAAGRSHVHPDGGWRSRQGLGTLRAHTRPSGRRLFVAGRGWVPSGRALVHPDGGWRACACSLWPGRAGRPPGRVVVRLTFSFGRFVFLLCSAPSGLGLPPSLLLPLPFLVALALCFGCFSRPPAAWLLVCSRLVCVSRLAVGCSLVVSPPPLPFCVSRFLALLLGAWVVFFFFFFPFFPCAPPLSPAFSGFRPRVPWTSALCVVCLVGLPPLGSPCACASFVPSAWLVVAPRRLLPPPRPPFLSRGFRRCRLALWCAVLCCASLGAVLRRAAARCVLRCCAVLCCVVLVGCRCLLRRALWRCPLPWGPVLCGVAFCGAPPCCVCFVVARWWVLLFAALLCAVCVPGCCAVRSLSSPLSVVLCFAVLVRLRCAVRVVRAVAGAWCCGVPWCGAGSGGPWLSAGGVFLCRCPCLAAWSVALWLVWFGVLPCFPVSCSVVLCCRAVLCCCALLSCCSAVGACFALLWAVVLCCVVLLVGCAVFCPVVVSACCGALFLVLCVPCLLRSVRCGALLCWLWCPASLCRVLWRCAVVWCCAVVLCCRFAVLLVFALPSCGPSCGASVVCAVVGASCCGVSLCVVVSPWAFCGVVVLLWCVVVSCCAARCPVVSCALCRVLRCRAALRCCAGLLCCAAGVCFSFCPLFLCVGVVVPT